MTYYVVPIKNRPSLVREQTAQVEQMCSEIDVATNAHMVRHLRHILEQRMALFPRIMSGEFDELPPLMQVGSSAHIGKALLSGPMMQAGGATVGFSIPPLPANLPLRGAYILGVPSWYPYWRGDL